MIYINVKLNKFWKLHEYKDLKIWFKGYIHSFSIDKLAEIFKDIKENEVSTFIASLEGHFALIVQKNDFTFLAVDKIRSTPLFFVNIKDNFFLDYDPKNLVKLNGFDKTINDDAKIEIAMSGFTIGNKTIYKNLNSLIAGELVLFKYNNYKYEHYYKYFGKVIDKSIDEYLLELTEVTLNIFRRMLNQIGNRQIVIPLSGGHDSRLIASILRHLGAKNVKCYTYGTSGNFEAKIAKKIAQKLGYNWRFVPLTFKSEKKYYNSNEFNDYLNFSESYSSVPFIQSLSSIKYLKDSNWINEDAIFINGLSGDFISGGHADIKNGENYNLGTDNIETLISRKKNILNKLIEKHFSLWGYLKTNQNLNRVKDNLWNEIDKGCINLENEQQDHLSFEYSELIGRQSKYVLKKQKVYEFYGHEWRLPFWEDKYLYFWKKIPLHYKLKQKLYIEMLRRNNFGNVWGDDFYINKKTIVPKWIIPIRFICKIPFSFFGQAGKKIWKQFDINFFKYFMSIPHTWDMFNYFRIIKDIFKKPRNSVSWQVEDYLKKFKR